MNLSIEERVRNSIHAHMESQRHVSAIDVLRGTGLLQEPHYFDWIDGRTLFLESAISASPAKLDAALQEFENRGRSLNLRQREAVYFSATRHPRQLLYSEVPARSRMYMRRYFSPDLSDAEVDRLQQRLSSPPELVVFDIIRESKCSACGTEIPRNNFLFMEAGNPLCLDCAELGGLAYLAPGNSNLTRHAHQLSTLSAVVLRFSRTRRRYERKGLLLEEEAISKAESELSAKTKAR